MAKHIDSLMNSLKIRYTKNCNNELVCLALLHPQLYRFSDLINEDGITFEIGSDFNPGEEEEEDEFTYSPYVQFSNEEMLNMLNMNDFEDENEDEKVAVTLCGMSFSKLKAKMTSLTADEKVNQILYYFLNILFHRDDIFDRQMYRCD